MPFREFIDGFKYDPDTFKADEFIAAVKREYETDESAWTAKVTTVESTVAEKDALITEQKTQLWDYYMKSGKPIPGNNASGGQVPPVDQEESTEYVPKGVSSLFGNTEKKE